MILIPYKIVVRKRKFLLESLHSKPFILVDKNLPWIASGFIMFYNYVERHSRTTKHCAWSRVVFHMTGEQEINTEEKKYISWY